MTLEQRGPRNLGSIIGGAWRLYAANFRLLFLIALITVPLQMLQAVVQRIAPDNAAAVITLLIQVPNVLVTLIATAALIFAVHAVTGGATVTADTAIDTGMARFGALLTTNLLAAALFAASIFAFPFLAIWWLTHRDATIDGRRDPWLLLPLALPAYLIVRWIMTPQAIVLEDRVRWHALDASADVVRGQWWRVLGILLVASLVIAGPTLLAAGARALPPLAEAVTVSLVAALTLPYYAAAQTLLYYDLQARRNAHASPA